jgi:hypothetical protein
MPPKAATKVVPSVIVDGIVYEAPERREAVALRNQIAQPSDYVVREVDRKAILKICSVHGLEWDSGKELLREFKTYVHSALYSHGICPITGRSIKLGKTKLWLLKKVTENRRAWEAVSLAILGDLADRVKLIFNKRTACTCGKRPALLVLVPRVETTA